VKRARLDDRADDAVDLGERLGREMVQRAGAADDRGRLDAGRCQLLDVGEHIGDPVAEAGELLACLGLHRLRDVHPRAAGVRIGLEPLGEIRAVAGAEVDDVRDVDARVLDERERDPARQHEHVGDHVLAEPLADVLRRLPRPHLGAHGAEITSLV
jgi:hypothetical protein